MKYLCLIYSEPKVWAGMSDDDRKRMSADYYAFTDQIKKSGHYLGGNPLQPVSTAASVRVRNGKPSATDGPFAETKEQLGGYYLIEAADMDEAIVVAAGIPGAKVGTIEVRPVAPFGND